MAGSKVGQELLEFAEDYWRGIPPGKRIPATSVAAIAILSCSLQLDRLASAIERNTAALERIADRFDSDAKQFSEMVEKGKGLSA